MAGINRLPDANLLEIYDKSYGYARFHGIDKIIFHANYLSGVQTQGEWVRNKVDFWKRFLQDKPERLCVYVENFIDDTPDLLAGLCDAVNDPRFAICFDTGHACCNAAIHPVDWIAALGGRIGHAHLHNNDGVLDRHWPLAEG